MGQNVHANMQRHVSIYSCVTNGVSAGNELNLEFEVYFANMHPKGYLAKVQFTN